MEIRNRKDLKSEPKEVRDMVKRSVVKMVKEGALKKDAADFFGVNLNSVTVWCKAYEQSGYKGLQERVKGVKLKTNSKLTLQQEKQVVEMITDTMPDQLKLNYGLWTRKAVVELIARELGVNIAVRTMGNYLKSWGFTPQKPKKVAYEQRPAEIKKWLVETYPRIEQRAKAEGTEIHWGDETGVRNDCQHGRSFAPKGRTPAKKSMAKRFSVNMISTITNQGKVSFMIYPDMMNADRFISFLKQLVKWRKKKIFLIVDNLRVHHSKLVKAWVAEHLDRIELFYLPAYSPQHNPDEYLNCDLKQALSNKQAPKEKQTLKNNVREHMELLQNKPQRVKSYFRHQDINYAA